AAPAREAGHVRRLLGDDRHVACRRPDVLGGHVAPAERADGVAEVAQRVAAARGAHVALGRHHDHALAAAQRQVGDGVLERHRPRQPQRVAHGRPRVVVAPHPAAAERRPAGGGVHGAEDEEPGPASPAHQELLVVEGDLVAVDDQLGGVVREGLLPASPPVADPAEPVADPSLCGAVPGAPDPGWTLFSGVPVVGGGEAVGGSPAVAAPASPAPGAPGSSGATAPPVTDGSTRGSTGVAGASTGGGASATVGRIGASSTASAWCLWWRRWCAVARMGTAPVTTAMCARSACIAAGVAWCAAWCEAARGWGLAGARSTWRLTSVAAPAVTTATLQTTATTLPAATTPPPAAQAPAAPPPPAAAPPPAAEPPTPSLASSPSGPTPAAGAASAANERWTPRRLVRYSRQPAHSRM